MSRVRGFALAPFDDFLAAMPDLDPGELTIARFANGELHVALGTDVRGDDCALVGSIAPPDEQLTRFLLAAHTLAKEGARTITAVLPYLAYARQDTDERGRSRACEWTGRLLAACGVDRLLTVDIHSPAAIRLCGIPVESVSPAPLFAGELARLGLDDYVVVAPDEGGVDRARDLAAAAGLDRPVVVFRKRRSAEGIVHLGMTGELDRTAVVVDDILDTGATLVSCCQTLRGAGVERIVVFVTHGLFTGDDWQALWRTGVERIYATDSVGGTTTNAPDNVRTLSVASLLVTTAAD